MIHHLFKSIFFIFSDAREMLPTPKEDKINTALNPLPTLVSGIEAAPKRARNRNMATNKTGDEKDRITKQPSQWLLCLANETE